MKEEPHKQTQCSHADVRDALEEARSVISSINSGRNFEVTKFGERGYWQRWEWVEWALNEVLPMVDSALAATRNQTQEKQPADPAPINEWDEDHGNVLWWRFPIEEPPYCGTPLDDAWPGYHTHWTPLLIPNQPPKNEG